MGVSSLSLLHILDQQLQVQLQKSGRAAFTLHIVHVHQSQESDQGIAEETLDSLQKRFPLHAYSTVHLHDIFDYQSDIDMAAFSQSNEQGQDRHSISHRDRLENFLASLPSASSKNEIISTIRTQLIMAFAKRNECFGILYGDSTTRLAERTLSETARGRGGYLPWLTADDMSPIGIRVIYPMRDLLKKELSAYTDLVEPQLTPFVEASEIPIKGPVSARDTTIDGLMRQYFASVEQDYPSIVANVVRTSGRLVAPMESMAASCQICGLPLEDVAGAWAGNQEAPSAANEVTSTSSNDSHPLCYGCLRTVGGNKVLSSVT